MENLKFMVVLCVYSGSGGQELETTVKTKKQPEKNTIFKLSFKIQNSWVFLGLYSGFGGQELKATVKTKKQPKTRTNHQNHRKNKENQKNHNFQTISQNPEFVVFFLVFTVASSS